jgi:GNAT superfamily N-acetyltransferase
MAPPSELEIVACTTRSLHRAFEHAAEVLHRGSAAFVPPFPGSVAKFLGAKCTFSKHQGEIQGFLALRGGRPVGRIAAILNRLHNEYYKDRTGFFGFFECENNASTARALFERAEQWVAARGLSCLRGPYNPTINNDCGILLDGYGARSMIGLPWNPDYYPALLTLNGFELKRVLHAFNLPLQRVEIPARLKRIAERLKARHRLTIRPFSMKRLPEELRILQTVYNATLERNWGFVPLTYAELLEAAKDFRVIADPRLLLVAESAGRPAGVAISLPNFNELLAAVKNTPRPLRLLHLLLLMKTRRIRTGRLTILGVVPEFRDRGLHAWLIYEQFRIGKDFYVDSSLGWVEDTNTEVLEVCQVAGGELERSWGIYERMVQTTQ